MIRRLKTKFIALAMAAICVLLAVIVVGMNLINYNAVVAEADSTLSILSQNRGSFPNPMNDRGDRFLFHMSPELPYESRYFSVLFDGSGSVILTDTGKIAAVDSASAVEYAYKAMQSRRPQGFIGNFRYQRSDENGHTRIIFLDCGRKLDSFYTFLYASLAMTLAGIIIVFFVIFFFAGKIVRPIAQSHEKQKRFITDAGHEIKTPLTIIRANVDILEMEFGERNECLEDIQLQTQRLTQLTNDLVLLARMEESENNMQMIDFPVSEIVAEEVMPFRTLAQTQDKQFICDIQPTLTMNGNAKAIRQLVSLLMDNALKYSPARGTISVTMEQSGKSISLTVYNTTEEAISREDLNHVFDRFYRADASRNSESGGYGIGLSVAKAIVTAHAGKIQASTTDGHSFQINVTLPI